MSEKLSANSAEADALAQEHAAALIAQWEQVGNCSCLDRVEAAGASRPVEAVAE
ncbi:hypothetical protein [Variovorax sp. RCC_210]|uniref:hypothetical protein n=1 Tax=Variovorax sp. RCC_210 TaxID=3239217 RepID=UPI003525D230